MRLNIFKFLKLKKGDYIIMHTKIMRVCVKYRWNEIFVCREEFYKDDPIPAYRYSLLDYIFDVNKF